MARPKKIEVGKTVDEISVEEKKRVIKKSFFDALCPSELLDLDEWADVHRILPKETSDEHGQWTTSRFPFIRRIMKCISPNNIAKEVVAIKGHQLAFTETAITWSMYNADMNPGPMMYVQKTEDDAKDFSNQKLKPNLLVNKKIINTLGADKPKGYSNAWDNKGYPGGFLVMGGANSSSFLRSKSIRDLILDEEDTYKSNIDDEGSPVQIAKMRQSNFKNKKTLRISTPTIKETSTIEPAYEAGSQEQYYIPCPDCGSMFVLQWSHIKWSKEIDSQNELPREVWCECPNCAERIDEHNKTWMLDNGLWMSEKGSKGYPYEVGDCEYPSFQISSLYSPFGFYSWRDAVKMWFDYQRTGDKALLQVFVNQVLGETYELTGSDISYNYLMSRREPYPNNFDIPNGGLVLTAGADIQDDRIEIEVVAWGLFEENFSVDYAVLMGDTSNKGDNEGLDSEGNPTVWRLLDEYLVKQWRHQNGNMMQVEITMIDSGYKTEEVQVFCRLREHRRIFPVKGRTGWGHGYLKRPKRRHERYGTFSFEGFVDEVKNKVQAQLMVDVPGPGFCHFPIKDCYNENYFKGLTAESKKIKMVGGQKKVYWDCPSGVRNEPTDCRAYNYIALVAYPVNLAARANTKAGVNMPVPVPQAPRRKRHPGVS